MRQAIPIQSQGQPSRTESIRKDIATQPQSPSPTKHTSVHTIHVEAFVCLLKGSSGESSQECVVDRLGPVGFGGREVVGADPVRQVSSVNLSQCKRELHAPSRVGSFKQSQFRVCVCWFFLDRLIDSLYIADDCDCVCCLTWRRLPCVPCLTFLCLCLRSSSQTARNSLPSAPPTHVHQCP